MHALKVILLVAGALPLIWSGLVFGLQVLFAKGPPEDATEKRTLIVMLAPVLIGIACILISSLLPEPVSLPIPHFLDDDGSAIAPRAALTTVIQPSFDWVTPALLAVTGLYLLGMVFGALRLLVAWQKLRVVVAKARKDGEGVRISDAAVPAFAWSRAVVVLPRLLIEALTPQQCDMLIRHERAHLKRRDTVYFLVLSATDVVFWCNPFVRRQTARCRLAAELACDAVATYDIPEMRKTYAASLLLALKHTAGYARPISTQACAPAVFSPSNSGEFKMRMTEIMRASPGESNRRKAARWLLPAAALLAVPLAGMQYAWSQNATPVAKLGASHVTTGASLVTVVDSSPRLSVVPVAGRVSSPYGKRIHPLNGEASFHNGIDIAADVGTPVHAPADGVVVAVYSNPRDGNALELDHGGGLKTRYTHLDSVSVVVGDPVRVNQVVAATGNSGTSTGPHAHFEVWQGDKRIDPASVLPQLATGAHS